MSYTIEMSEDAMVVKGPVPAGEMTALAAMAESRGFDRMDINVAQVLGATLVITGAEGSAKLRASIERENAGRSAEDAWLNGCDTGISSRAIFALMTGRHDVARGWGTDHPHDPDDFGRCHRLLKKFPAWRARIWEMGALSSEWAQLANHWDELEALFEEEEPTGRAPKLYARMHELTQEPR
jgi:hypothetical protein